MGQREADCGGASAGGRRMKDTSDRGEKKEGEGPDGRKIERT